MERILGTRLCFHPVWGYFYNHIYVLYMNIYYILYYIHSPKNPTLGRLATTKTQSIQENLYTKVVILCSSFFYLWQIKPVPKRFKVPKCYHQDFRVFIFCITLLLRGHNLLKISKYSNDIWYSDNPLPIFAYPTGKTQARITHAHCQIE